MEKTPISIFYCYSHKDELLKQQLETHLSLLRRRGYIKTWHDRRIGAGREWESAIDNRLDDADVILLLVSPDFTASDYCYDKELTRAMERHECRECLVIPVILRPVDWSEAPFSKLQALPKDGKPVVTWSNEDEAWLDVERGIKRAIEEIHELKYRSAATTGLIAVRDVIVDEIKRLESTYFEPNAGKRYCTGIPTGIIDLDRLLDGLHASELVVVAGRPSMGKSDFVASIAAKSAIEQNRAVAFFSMQMSAQQVARRLLSATSKVNFQRIARGFISEKDFPRLVLGVGKLVDAPLYFDQSPRLSINDILRRARALKAQNRIDLMVIDSLQQVLVPPARINDTVGALKALGKELQIPVVVTCNVVREVEKRTDKRPIVSDLGDWRSLEDESDVLLFLYRDEVYNFGSPDQGIIEFEVAKNRNGPSGTVRALYSPEESMFKDLILSEDENVGAEEDRS